VTSATVPDDQSGPVSATAGQKSPLLEATRRLEADSRLDPVSSALAGPARLVSGPFARRVLGGKWLGHALHPLLTDFPLGCWLGAGLLDVLSGRRDRDAARRLVGLGVLFALPTAATGLSDWSTITDEKARRVGTSHAVLNAVALGSYFSSWMLRRRSRHLLGLAAASIGAGAAWVSGYLGGHMTLNQKLGGEPD
jgi:hypothetical protein